MGMKCIIKYKFYGEFSAHVYESVSIDILFYLPRIRIM